MLGKIRNNISLMKPHFFIFLFSTYQLSGQLTENFEKAEISKWYESVADRWNISSERPLSGNYSLHHVYDNSKSDHDQISFMHDPLILDSAMTIWKFRIRYEYDPSPYNHWAVFLVSDKNAASMHPDENCNGYILGVNYTGSEDCIKFWKSKDNQISEILNTGFNWQNEIGKNTPATLEVIRFQTGKWEFYIDTALNVSCKIKLGEAEDSELKVSNFFGLYYRYSSGQDRKLWLDDIYINGLFLKDSMPPRMNTAICPEPSQLIVQFNEPITITADSRLEIKTGFETKNIDSILVSCKNLHIWMKDPISNESEISVKVCYIRDIYGNISDCESIELFYYQPGFNDLIVTEIMADPTPPVNLPEAEYLELYNRGKYPVDLYGWKIYVGGRCSFFSQDTIHPKAYKILIDSKKLDMFTGMEGLIPMDDFPVISNEGQVVVLKDNHENIIFATEYQISWYQEYAKSEGGWSLEMIDPENPCGRKKNWKASIDANGGTPGYINSVNGNNTDNDNPEFQRPVITDDSVLYLHFSETVTGQNLYTPTNYLINNEMGYPYRIVPASDLSNSVIMYFDKLFRNNTYYTLRIKNTFADCAGNKLDNNIIFSFRMPSGCDSMDLIINEILFDPIVAGGEFIEIYNRSMKTIDLKDFYLALKDPYSQKPGQSYILSKSPFTLEPGSYLALTENTSLITDYYHFKSWYDFLEMENIPNLPNTTAIISLFDPNDRIIDEVAYSSDMHVEIMFNTKGISLERIDPDGNSNYRGNWYTSSGDFGYATPGYENSQSGKDHSLSFSFIAEPEIITPDGDGVNDATVIKYVVGDAGYFANIIVFDRAGRPVKILARNMLLGSTGELIWGGKTGEGRTAPVGPYLIYSEIFNLKGDIKKFKNSCIIAEKIY